LSAILNREEDMMAEPQYSSLPSLAAATVRAGSALAA